MIEAPALQIFRDVGIDQPDLPAARICLGFGDRRLAAAQRLHLRSSERDAGLEGLADLVIERGFAVLRDNSNLLSGFAGICAPLVATTRASPNEVSSLLATAASRPGC
jgi:hypothetical protein